MITSLQNTLIKDYAKLHQKKHRQATQTFIIEGAHLVEEAAKKNIIKAVITTEKRAPYDDAILVSDAVMKKLTKTHHLPLVIAVCHMVKPKTITDRVLLLEHIQDPGNLGTLLRSALAFSFTTIVLDNTVDLYNPKVLRSTQGALFHLNIVHMSAKAFKDTYKAHRLIATDVNGQASLAKPAGKYALVLGNEGAGITKDTLALADDIVSIPMDTMESLNVGVAGSIIMHQLNGKSFIK